MRAHPSDRLKFTDFLCQRFYDRSSNIIWRIKSSKGRRYVILNRPDASISIAHLFLDDKFYWF